LNDTSFQIVIVTNQAGIGKGLIQAEVALEINQRLVSEICSHGGRIDRVYVCPHTAEMNCSCRKPLPGLIFQAAAELGIDLSQSVLIGDALSDLQAGRSAGIGRLILVKTGLGMEQFPRIAATFSQPFDVYANLLEAVQSLTY
jgi:D-glycero-D-manno-heptose 1,7-bisphosphate phosphatase